MPVKAGIALTWIFAVVSLFMGEGTLWSIGRVVFWGMLAIHVVECVVFLPTLRRAGGSLAGHLAQVMAFGVFHYREVKEQLEAAPTA